MRDWRGPIALVLAVGVALTMIVGVITAELTPGKVTTEEVSFLSTLSGAAVGALGAYLGIATSHKSDQDKEAADDDGPEPEP